MRTTLASAAVAVVGIAAAPVCAFDNIYFNWTWVTVEAGTSNVIQPAVPGTVSPGEGLEFRGSFTFDPPIGTVRPHLHGAVMGLKRMQTDFLAGAGHGGTFHAEVGRIPAIGDPPLLEPDRIHNIQIGQEAIDGLPLAYVTNSFEDAIIVRWTPQHYTPRTVDFELVRSTATPVTHELWTILQTPHIYTPFSVSGGDIIGGSIQVNVIPAPTSAAIFVAAGLMAARRRRR